MKTIFTSVKIWLKTVVFNAIFFGFGALLNNDVPGVVIGFIFLIAGLFLSAPLLLVIDRLVKLSIRLPYPVAARIAWLFFILVILILLFYVVVLMLFDRGLITKDILPFSGITSAALLIAVLTTRKSLIKLNTPNVL